MAGSYIIKNFLRIKLFQNWKACIAHVISGNNQTETGCPNQEQESSMSEKKLRDFHVSDFLPSLESREENSRHLSNTQVIQFYSEDRSNHVNLKAIWNIHNYFR